MGEWMLAGGSLGWEMDRVLPAVLAPDAVGGEKRALRGMASAAGAEEGTCTRRCAKRGAAEGGAAEDGIAEDGTAEDGTAEDDTAGVGIAGVGTAAGCAMPKPSRGDVSRGEEVP